MDHFYSACEFSQISIFINNKYKIASMIHCLLTYLLFRNWPEYQLWRNCIVISYWFIFVSAHFLQMDNLHVRSKRVITCHLLQYSEPNDMWHSDNLRCVHRVGGPGHCSSRSLIDRGRSPDVGAGAVLVITWASRGWCNVGSINIWCQTRDLVMKCSVHS